MNINELMNINDVRESATIFSRPFMLTFAPLTLKVVSESRVTWATCAPILVFLGLPVLELFPMYATDRRQTASSLNAPARIGGIKIYSSTQLQNCNFLQRVANWKF